MRTSLSFARLLLCVGCTTLISTSVFATSVLSSEERNTILKEDIAAAQVMQEQCPKFVADPAKINAQVKSVISEYIAELSGQSMDYDSLQKDAEYQDALKIAREDMQQTAAEEIKQVCEELASI